MNYKIRTTPLFLFALFFALVAHPSAVFADRGADPADESSVSSRTAQEESGATSSRTTKTEPLRGSNVEEPSKIPNTLFWKKVGQKISLFFTFDSVEDAKKRVEYAEENMLLAEFIVRNRTSESHDKMVADLVTSANGYIQDIQVNIDSFVNNAEQNEGVKVVLENMTTHIQNKQKLLGTIKEHADVSKLNELVDSIIAANDLQQQVTATVQDAAVTLQIDAILNKIYTIPSAVLDLLKNDQDGDGLSDQKEDEAGTSKFDFDTDGDGLSDKEELEVTGTNPLKTDTDDDGYWDGFEILQGYSPTGPGEIQQLPLKPLLNIDIHTGLLQQTVTNQ